MFKLRAPRAVIAMGMLTTIGLSSCGVSTVQQCNNLAEVMNQGEEFKSEFEAEMDAFGAQFQNSENDIASINAMATSYVDVVGRVVVKIEEMATDLTALELQDETLAGYRDQYATVTSNFAQELTKTSKAMSLLQNVSTDEELMTAALSFQEEAVDAFTNLTTLSEEGDDITGQIQGYCEAEAG